MSDNNTEIASESEEQFSQLLDAFQTARSQGTLAAFWRSQKCSPELRARLMEIGSAISDVELYFASTRTNQVGLEFGHVTWEGTIPGYTIEREIGRGSNGTVYLALDTRLNRNVAIKVPHQHSTDSSSSRLRFQREAELAAGVDHPHILPIYEIGTFPRIASKHGDDEPSASRETHYIVSAYCPGPNLRQWLDTSSQSLSIQQSVELILRLSEGLEPFHSRSILHRDIKPANVMLFPVPCGSLPFWPKLTDFGLAKELDRVVELTTSDECVGTPRYMAPEQISKSSAKIGTATDVYALGVLLYELLAGRPPFDANALPALFEQIRTAQPPALRALCSRVPRDLEVICSKCLHKNSAQRYSSAGELAEDLRRCLDGRPILAKDNSKRSASEWATLAVAVLLVGIITPGWLQLSRSLARPDQNQRPSTATTSSATSLPLDATLMDGHKFTGEQQRVYVAALPKINSVPFTIEAWICPSYPRGMVLNFGGIASLFSDDGLAWTGPCLNLMLPNSPMLFLHAETTLVPEKWSHVACVFDGQAVAMYINGQRSAIRIYSEDNSGQRDVVQQLDMELLQIDNLRGNGKLAIGGNFPGSFERYRYPFNGSIGAVRISNIARYANNFVPTRDLTVDDATLSLYRFESSTDSSVVDESQHAATAHLFVH